MIKTKEILLGLFVGFTAYYIYIITIGMLAAYLPVNYQKMTEGLTNENAILIIQTYHVFLDILAASVMAIAAYIFMRVFKLKASKLFLIISLVVFILSYLLIFYETIDLLLNNFFSINAVIPIIFLWFSVSRANKANEKNTK